MDIEANHLTHMNEKGELSHMQTIIALCDTE